VTGGRVMDFEVIGKVVDVESFAVGGSIRERHRLRRAYGAGRWRKRKGVPKSGWRITPSVGPKFMGTKLTASGGRK
jgi:hypothetical protein